MKYIGPKLKIQRRLGNLFSLAKQKNNIKNISPGEHGKIFDLENPRSSIKTSYNERFLQKQKLKYFYGISEKQLFSYYNSSKNKFISREESFIQGLELRLDNIIFQLGFAPTIASARQYILHGHFLVNNYKINIPSFSCSKGDIITLKPNSKIKILVEKNLKIIKLKNENIIQNLKDSESFNKDPLTIIPSYLNLIENSLTGKIISKPSLKDLKIEVDFLKIIEYYSK